MGNLTIIHRLHHEESTSEKKTQDYTSEIVSRKKFSMTSRSQYFSHMFKEIFRIPFLNIGTGRVSLTTIKSNVVRQVTKEQTDGT